MRPLEKSISRLDKSVSVALEVEDYRDGVLELVGDVLNVIEVLGRDKVDSHVTPLAVGTPTHGAQRGRSPLGNRVVGEDVVDLVAPAARTEPMHPLALAVVRFEVGFRFGLVLLLLVFLVVCEAEVDERAMPGVAKGHLRLGVRGQDRFPCGIMTPQRQERR